MYLIMSASPNSVKLMREGKKTIDFRKQKIQHKVSKVYIHENNPTDKIVGYIEIGEFIDDTVDGLWEDFADKGGMTKKEFDKYFKKNEFGYAMEILKYHQFDNKVDTRELIDCPPIISNMYIPEYIAEIIEDQSK